MSLLGLIVLNKANSKTELKISTGPKKEFRQVLTKTKVFFKFNLEGLQLPLPMPPKTTWRKKKPHPNHTCSLSVLLAS